MSVQILTDSTSDILPEEAEQKGGCEWSRCW